MNWYITVLKNFRDFEGRAGRKEFWTFTLFNLIFSIVLMLIDSLIFQKMLGTRFTPLSSLYSIILLIPSLAVSVRRLHDRELSGLHLLLGFIPLVGGLILIILFAQKGSDGSNKYGSKPNEPISVT